MTRAVFLDRDGTIIHDRKYLADPDGVALIDGAVPALLEWRARGFLLVVVSNQSGVGRGLITLDAHVRVAERFTRVLADAGVTLDGVYYCLHAPNDGCECRKPLPGLIVRAARELEIDLTASLVIGDKSSDVAAGRAAGCEAALFVDWITLREKLSSRFR